jgi:hypothetical protein
MIRNIKKIINLKNNLDLKFQFPNVLKKNLFEKLNYLKSSIKLKKQISLNKITNINFELKKNPEKILKQKPSNKELEFKNVEEENIFENRTDNNLQNNINKKSHNKFLKKKLQRKLGRLKRKIKRYKFTGQTNNDINQVQTMQDQNSPRLDEINSKIKNLQLELQKLQTEDSSNLDQSNIKKLRNKYKKKIKKLRNKINKLSKNQNVKDNIVELKSKNIISQPSHNSDEKEEINKNENLLANENIQTTDKKNEDYISELKNQIENFKEQNETLNLKLLEHQEKDNNEEKIQVSELQQKIKYYQDENLRLSNLVVNNEKTIEIMRNQINGFENLKQKLYEQVNSLGDTLINNDNIENIFENKKVVSEQNDHHHQEELKVVNSSENVQVEEKKIQASTSNRINSKTDYSIKEMDAAIKNIFEN